MNKYGIKIRNLIHMSYYANKINLVQASQSKRKRQKNFISLKISNVSHISVHMYMSMTLNSTLSIQKLKCQSDFFKNFHKEFSILCLHMWIFLSLSLFDISNIPSVLISLLFHIKFHLLLCSLCCEFIFMLHNNKKNNFI